LEDIDSDIARIREACISLGETAAYRQPLPHNMRGHTEPDRDVFGTKPAFLR
jgi:hypothetical protein